MRKHRRMGILGAFLAVLLLAGVAFAAWTANGTGSGNAKAVTAATVTVNAVTGSADLYPGGSAGRVYFTLTNTNPYAITFDKLTAASVTAVSGGIGGSPACATTDLTVSTLPITGLSLTVGANTTSATQNIAGVVAMNSTAPDSCQGAVFTVSLTLTGSQS
ncbi:MAG: hypothetical protein ACXVQ5_05010 [Actinomycetota bacterium]